MASAVQAVYRRSLSQYCKRLAYTASRYESSTVSADLSMEHEEDPDATIPLVPKHRDPHAVLKALSSTLTPLPLPLLMGGRSFADPMAPRTRALQLEFQRARVAGRKSAQYVINRWPAMFPDLHTDHHTPHTTSHGVNEETLTSLIARKQTGRAMKLFRKLQEKGDAVSLETQNGLLELLAYYGLGNPWRVGRRGSGVSVGGEDGEMVTEGEEGVEELDRLGEELGKTGSEEAAVYLGHEAGQERSNKDRAHLLQFHRSSGRIWSMDNHAERFFAEMAEKNGSTYDALILGLVKFSNYDRAWEVLEDMRQDHHQASLATYNSLLYAIGNSTVRDPWNKAMSLVQLMSEEPAVQPNITTMNLLLEIGAQTDPSSARQLSLKTFRETLHLGLELNLSTFLTLLRAHIKSSDGSVLYDITDYLEKNQHILQVTDTQDIFFFSVAMTAARGMLDHELALRLRTLCDRDNWILCQNLTLFVSYYLTTITGRVSIDTLKEEYNYFVPRVVLPMEWVYGIMFRACEEQDNPTFALELWNHMIKHHVTISSVNTLSRLCGAMAKKIFPSEVDAILGALMQAWNKCQEINIQPPSVMISQLIRLHCLKSDLNKAWKYFLYFEEYDRQPNFRALVSLLKAYSNVQNADKTVELLGLILKYGMILPTVFVRDVCWTAGVSETDRIKLVSQFSRRDESRPVQTQESDNNLL